MEKPTATEDDHKSEPHPQLTVAPPLRLSAKATRADGTKLTDEEIEAAEEEALAWARRANSC